MPACIFTAQAESDLEAIGDYIALDNPVRARSFVQEIRRRCEKIIQAPEGYTTVPEYGENIRRVAFGNYLIFYTIHDDAVVILHVHHRARNLPG